MAKKLLFVAALLVALSSCGSSRPDLKSPCVGGEGSPCDRRSVNNNLS